MSRSKARFSVFLALIFLFTGLGPAFGGTLNDQLKNNKNKQAVINKQISKYKDEEEELKDDIANTLKKISATEEKLEAIRQQLDAANLEVEKAEKELNDAEDELNQRIQTLQKRIRGVYEQGQTGYLEVLFQSVSLGDFFDNLEYVNKILENDQKLVKDISRRKLELESKRNELVKKRDEVEKVKADQEKEKKQLEDTKAYLLSRKKELNARLDNLFEEIQSYKKEEDRIRDLISRSTVTSGKPSALVWPAPSVHTISSRFGYRYHPILHVYKLHTGIDIPVPVGSQVVAAASGQVIYAGSLGGYGYAVIIAHGGSMQTLYAHNSSFAVKVGQTVQAGQTISYSGGAAGMPGAGYSTGPHLHFEVRINGVPTDPLSYL